MIVDVNKFFDMMLSDGCMLNVVIYIVLIDGYCKCGDIEKVCNIYVRMRG